MKQTILVGFTMFLFSTISMAQSKENSNEPDIQIYVEEHYDDQGNVIGKDSTYQWSWSSSDVPINLDSLFQSFGFGGNSSFNFDFPKSNDWIGQDFPFDSLFNDRSFHFDFFQNQNMSEMMKEMHRMMRQNLQPFQHFFDDNGLKFFRIDPNSRDSLRFIQPKLNPSQKQI